MSKEEYDKLLEILFHITEELHALRVAMELKSELTGESSSIVNGIRDGVFSALRTAQTTICDTALTAEE